MSFTLSKFRRMPDSATKEWQGDEEPPFVEAMRLADRRRALNRHARDWRVRAVSLTLGWVLLALLQLATSTVVALAVAGAVSVVSALVAGLYFWRLVKVIVAEREHEERGSPIRMVEPEPEPEPAEQPSGSRSAVA